MQLNVCAGAGFCLPTWNLLLRASRNVATGDRKTLERKRADAPIRGEAVLIALSASPKMSLWEPFAP
jgi:hypothetical protein